MSNVCEACGLPRARPGEARRNMRFLFLAVALATPDATDAALDKLAPLARCWSGVAETCGNRRAREKAERAELERRAAERDGR